MPKRTSVPLIYSKLARKRLTKHSKQRDIHSQAGTNGFRFSFRVADLRAEKDSVRPGSNGLGPSHKSATYCSHRASTNQNTASLRTEQLLQGEKYGQQLETNNIALPHSGRAPGINRLCQPHTSNEGVELHGVRLSAHASRTHQGPEIRTRG